MTGNVVFGQGEIILKIDTITNQGVMNFAVQSGFFQPKWKVSKTIKNE